MRVKTVSVSYTRKINLGNYNSAEVGATLWAELEPGEDIGDGMHNAMNDLWTACKANVKAQLIPLTVTKDDQIVAELNKLFLGVPVVSTPPTEQEEQDAH